MWVNTWLWMTCWARYVCMFSNSKPIFVKTHKSKVCLKPRGFKTCVGLRCIGAVTFITTICLCERSGSSGGLFITIYKIVTSNHYVDIHVTTFQPELNLTAHFIWSARQIQSRFLICRSYLAVSQIWWSF